MGIDPDINRSGGSVPAFPIVAHREIGGDELQSVNARDLHGFLSVGKRFADWIKDRIEQYDFELGRDFEVFEDLSYPVSGSSKSRPQAIKEYAITLDMAKELSMVERNDQGKRARQYFIECERRVQQPQVAANQNIALVGREARLQFRMGLSVAKMLGLSGNQAALSANGLAVKTTGIDVLEAMGQTRLIAPQQEQLLTPTDIGRHLGGRSAIAVNALLESFGLQVGGRDHKHRTYWEPTEKGIRAGGVMVDRERSNKSGNSRQLLWSSGVVTALRDMMEAA